MRPNLLGGCERGWLGTQVEFENKFKIRVQNFGPIFIYKSEVINVVDWKLGPIRSRNSFGLIFIYYKWSQADRLRKLGRLQRVQSWKRVRSGPEIRLTDLHLLQVSLRPIGSGSGPEIHSDLSSSITRGLRPTGSGNSDAFKEFEVENEFDRVRKFVWLISIYYKSVSGQLGRDSFNWS